MKTYKEFYAKTILKEARMCGYEPCIMDLWAEDKLTLKQLIKKAGGINEVAKKEEVERLLKSKIDLKYYAEDIGISPEKLKEKLTELLNYIKKHGK